MSLSLMLPRRVAKLAWIIPIFFLGVSAHQGLVAFQLHATKTQGTDATADVQAVQFSQRSQVTYDYVSLRVPLSDGSVLTRDRLSLPHGVIPPLVEKERLAVRVAPTPDWFLLSGTDRSLVVMERIGETPVVDTQIRIAGINTLMALGAALLFGLGVFYWNRSLRREGDPAERGVTEPDPDHPARQIVRS